VRHVLGWERAAGNPHPFVVPDSSYVCRLRDNSAPQVLQDRPLSEEASAAGVLSDHQFVR
jgi:hypothetical protein